MGRRAPPTTDTNLHFPSKLRVHSAGAEPSVFEVVLRDQNNYKVFPMVSKNTV